MDTAADARMADVGSHSSLEEAGSNGQPAGDTPTGPGTMDMDGDAEPMSGAYQGSHPEAERHAD